MAGERSGLAQRLAPFLEPGSVDPLYRQIVNRLWLEVVTGTLDTGERLPTVRQLAVDLGVHPDTVARAYRELEALGILAVRPSGRFIALSSPDASALERQAQLERLCSDLLARAAAFGFTAHDLIETLRDLSANAPERGTRGKP